MSSRLTVFLDDGTAHLRCQVAHELVQEWLGGVTPSELHRAGDQRRAEILKPVRSMLTKAEGMWELEFRGGGPGPWAWGSVWAWNRLCAK